MSTKWTRIFYDDIRPLYVDGRERGFGMRVRKIRAVGAGGRTRENDRLYGEGSGIQMVIRTRLIYRSKRVYMEQTDQHMETFG